MQALLEIGVEALYLLALINPVSKVSVLSGVDGSEQRQAKNVALKSSVVATAILLGAMVFGDFFLRIVFHVELHALQLAGGSVLFFVGFNALRKGVFFEMETNSRFADMAIVPLACPMIAGPATIAAVIAIRGQQAFFVPVAAVILAVAVNHVIMQVALPIAALLTRFNLLGAMIRITGLIVMSIGTQMILDGIKAWQQV